jgi:hypothetical protein
MVLDVTTVHPSGPILRQGFVVGLTNPEADRVLHRRAAARTDR